MFYQRGIALNSNGACVISKLNEPLPVNKENPAPDRIKNLNSLSFREDPFSELFPKVPFKCFSELYIFFVKSRKN